MAKVLITGGAGFIGRHCARRFLEQGWEVSLFDCAPIESDDPFVESGCIVHLGDVRDQQAVVLAMEGCDAVVHLAALVSVPESIQNPEQTMNINVGGTRNVLAAAQRLGLSHAVFASSAAVYGEQGALPIIEATALESLSPYGESKIINERDITTARNQGLNAIALRFFNVYGPGQSVSSGYASLIPLFIDHLIQRQRPTIFGDGMQTRDFIHVEDLTHAIVKLASLSKPFSFPVANVATQTQTSVLDVFQAINHHLVTNYELPSIEPIYSVARPGDIMHSFGSSSRLQSIIDWQPRVGLKQGLSALIEHQKRSDSR
tara:strand:+ start:225 stop:1175 length:951 start_codon:yes stop_codon:yes gene_type:complete